MAFGKNSASYTLNVLLDTDISEESKKKIQEYINSLGIEIKRFSVQNDESMTAYQRQRNKIMNAFKGIPDSEADPATVTGIQMTGDASKVSGKIADDLMKVMKTSVGILEDIHTRIKQASPLLQSVESLFNLAMQLFFMPLGNKLAEVMLPAILELVDNVMAMWDKIEGMDLGDMLTAMIDYGVKIFGEYFNKLGDQLVEQGGLIGSLGQILKGLGGFIENHLADLIKFGVKLLETVMSNFGTLLTLFTEFKIASISLQLAQIAATIASSNAITAFTAGLATFAIAEGIANAALIGTGAGGAMLSMNAAASGAYVGPIEGGRAVRVAEGGEGEFILPESRLQSMMNVVSDRMVDMVSGLYADMNKQPVQIPQDDMSDRMFTSDNRLYGMMEDMLDKMDVSSDRYKGMTNEKDIDTSKIESMLEDMADMIPNDISENVTVIKMDEQRTTRSDDALQNLVSQMGDMLSSNRTNDVPVVTAPVDNDKVQFVFPTQQTPKSTAEATASKVVDTAPKVQVKTEAPKTENHTINNNFYINGYTDRELQDIIRQTVNEQVSQSKLRSGF